MKEPAAVPVICRRIIPAILLAALVAAISLPARADSAATYKAKCVACHGADGSGDTPAGKQLGAHDFKSPEVQQATDDALEATISNGKNKMPAYAKQLKPDQIKGLVAYVRELGKK